MAKKKKRPFALVKFPARTPAIKWTPVEMVEEFLADLKANKETPDRMLIVWFSAEADGSLRPHRWYAGMTRADEIALLELAKQIAMDDWRN